MANRKVQRDGLRLRDGKKRPQQFLQVPMRQRAPHVSKWPTARSSEMACGCATGKSVHNSFCRCPCANEPHTLANGQPQGPARWLAVARREKASTTVFAGAHAPT